MTADDAIEAAYYHLVVVPTRADALRNLRRLGEHLLRWYDELGVDTGPYPARRDDPAPTQLELVDVQPGP